MAEDKEKFYLGNKNLPTADTKFEYTPEMVNEIKNVKRTFYILQRIIST